MRRHVSRAIRIYTPLGLWRQPHHQPKYDQRAGERAPTRRRTNRAAIRLPATDGSAALPQPASVSQT
jgi:hypothetical protein